MSKAMDSIADRAANAAPDGVAGATRVRPSARLANPVIYLDNAATTAVDPRVVTKMVPYLYERFGNPASGTHVYGWSAEEAVEIAREEVAATIAAQPKEIVWTSGATEANNLALRGAAQALQARGRHIVSLKGEHASVRAPLQQLAREGWEITWLDVEADGRVDRQRFLRALRADTVLASTLWVNNETGATQDIAALAACCRAHGVRLHVDGAQAIGKLPVDVAALGIDLLSMSAHKLHGPKGIGALYVNEALRDQLVPQQLGGGQEQGLRAGTLPVHQIVGLGEAYRLARQRLDADIEYMQGLRERLWQGLAPLGGVYVNGDWRSGAPHILNLSFDGVDALALLDAVAPRLALSAGAACASTRVEPSPVLLAMGRTPVQALSAIRCSVSRYTEPEMIDTAVAVLTAAVRRLRGSGAVLAEPSGDDEDCPMKRLRRRRAARI